MHTLTLGLGGLGHRRLLSVGGLGCFGGRLLTLRSLGLPLLALLGGLPVSRRLGALPAAQYAGGLLLHLVALLLVSSLVDGGRLVLSLGCGVLLSTLKKVDTKPCEAAPLSVSRL